MLPPKKHEQLEYRPYFHYFTLLVIHHRDYILYPLPLLPVQVLIIILFPPKSPLKAYFFHITYGKVGEHSFCPLYLIIM